MCIDQMADGTVMHLVLTICKASEGAALSLSCNPVDRTVGYSDIQLARYSREGGDEKTNSILAPPSLSDPPTIS